MINRYIFHRFVYKVKNFILPKRDMAVAYGLSSLIDKKNKLHSIFLDYDIKNFSIVLKDVVKLQNKFNLSDAFIFKTKKGYHAIFFYDVVDFKTLEKVIRSSKVEWRYKSFVSQYKRVFLRVGGKYKNKDIEFVGVVFSERRPTYDELLYGMSLMKFHFGLINAINVPEKLLYST